MFTGDSSFAAASRAGNAKDQIELPKMREIDPHSDAPLEGDNLAGALRHLAASSRQGAPAEIGAGLTMAFRRHHARRRLRRRVTFGAIVAGFAVAVGLMSLSLRSTHEMPAKGIVQEQPRAVPVETPEVATLAKAVPSAPRPVAKHMEPRATNGNIASSHRQFLALPGYDPTIPADELSIVRVQLPASALWQMGAPVSPDSGARRFMADFVVSQDGTPYAVRLVQ
jgi:hypothetical protein